MVKRRARPGRGNGYDLTDRLLTPGEAAAFLGVKLATVYQWSYQRRLPKVKLFGPRGPVRFRLSDLKEIVAKGYQPALRSGRPATSDGSPPPMVENDGET